jgi:hypothetical protein
MGVGKNIKSGIDLLEDLLREVNKPAKAAVKVTEVVASPKSIKGAQDILPTAEREASLAKFLDKSAEKRRMYHGSDKPNITRFKTGKMMMEERHPGNTVDPWAVDNREAVFLTPETEFSNKYSGDEWNQRGDRAPTTYPVYVQAQNPWDFGNPEHIEAAKQKYKELFPIVPMKIGDKTFVPSDETLRHVQFDKWLDHLQERENNWTGIESPDIQAIIKALGHDSFYINERGTKNLGVYDPNKIKSALGNRGTYDINDPDITKAAGGEVHMARGGAMPKKTTLEEDLKSFKDPALALADLLAGLGRGTTAAATGIAGDLEELYRQFGKGPVANAVRLMIPKREGKATTFPTIEEMNAILPPVVPVGAGRSSQVADVGQFFGENNPLAPTAIAAVKPVAKAAAKGALDLARSEPARKAVENVVRATGAGPMRVVPDGSKRIAQTPYERSLEQGYNHDWFHGTTADIKSFDPRFLGESTGANSAKKGFFFARDPKSPPEHLKVKSNDPEAIELLRRFGMSDEEIAKKNAVSFEGHGSSTASDYAGVGGGRDYKEAMRNAALAEKRGDWDAYDKYTQEAEAAVFGERDYRQSLVAKHGDARDQLIHAIDQAFSYGRPEVYKNMSQEDLANLDKTRQRLMPYSWYMHENAPFEQILEEASKYGTERQLQNISEEIKNFKSATNERRLADIEQGANVLPVALRYNNPYVHDFGGASYRDESYSDLIDKALAGDHDALLLLNTFDPGGGSPKMVDVGVVFDPSQIRSRFAEFDPEFIESSDILKKTGGAVMMADGGLTIEEFLRKQGY